MNILFRNRSARLKLTFSAALILISLTFPACAVSLPNVKVLRAALAEEKGVPKLEGKGGELTRAKRENALRKRGLSESDRLNRQIQLIEELTGTPLVGGNRLKLLINGLKERLARILSPWL